MIQIWTAFWNTCSRVEVEIEIEIRDSCVTHTTYLFSQMLMLHFSFLLSLSLSTLLLLSLSSEMTSHPVFVAVVAVVALATMVNLITMVIGWVMTMMQWCWGGQPVIHPPDCFFFGFVQLLAFDVWQATNCKMAFDGWHKGHSGFM